MKIQTMKNIPAGDNPFKHDVYHMGTDIGKNVMVMMANFDKDFCSQLILIDKTTGIRMKVTFAPEK